MWERMVQCVKKVLRQTVKDVSPKEHILQFLPIEIENIVNLRPWINLMPNHFLIGYGNVPITLAANKADGKLRP